MSRIATHLALRQRGFTLVEILVVVVILVLLSALGYGTLNSILKQQRLIEASLDRVAEYQRAFMHLRTDLQGIRARPIRDEFGDEQPSFVGGPEIGIEFTRGGRRNPLNAPRAGLERVRYALIGDELTRAGWQVLDRAQDSTPLEARVLDEVQEVQWRFLDGQYQWVEAWPDPLNPLPRPGDSPLPLAVELLLQTRDLGELRYVFSIGRDVTADALVQARRASAPGADGGDPDDDGNDDPDDDGNPGADPELTQ